MAANFPSRENVHEGDRYVLTERFERMPGLNADIAYAYNPNFETLGTNGVSADHTFNVGGGINLATHGGASDSAILAPHLDAAHSAWAAITWKSQFQPHFSARIVTPAALTNQTFWLGFKKTNTPVIITDDDQVWFRYQNGTNTTWQCLYSIGGTDVAVDSGVTVAVSTVYRMWITVDSARVPSFWINGNLVATGAALTTNVTLIPYIGVLSAVDATAKTLVVRSIECSLAP